jgi:hypothetical protein
MNEAYIDVYNPIFKELQEINTTWHTQHYKYGNQSSLAGSHSDIQAAQDQRLITVE